MTILVALLLEALSQHLAERRYVARDTTPVGTERFDNPTKRIRCALERIQFIDFGAAVFGELAFVVFEFHAQCRSATNERALAFR